MKKLIINNTIAVIDDNQKFYFQHKVNNLDDYSIINLPVSKTIQIPRCQQNDEIFGYIGEIQRVTFNFDNDEKIALSYNQTKKVNYEFYDDSELISSGTLIVDNITEQNYEITLYDKLISVMEEMTGNEDGSGYLNSLDLYYKNTNNKIEIEANIDGITTLNDDNLKYTINIKDDTLNDNVFRCYNETSGLDETFELNESLTQLQSKTIKSYDVEFVTPINSVIYSINKKYNNLINVDSKLNSYFDELHLYCGKPLIYNYSNDFNIKSNFIRNSLTEASYYNFYNNFVSTNKAYLPLKDASTNQFLERLNGNHYFKLPIEIKLTQFSKSKRLGCILNPDGTYVNFNVDNLKYGDKLGEFYINTKIVNYTLIKNSTDETLGNTKFSFGNITTKCEVIYGVNTELVTVQRNSFELYQLVYTAELPLSYDFYQLIIDNYYNESTLFGLEFTFDNFINQTKGCLFSEYIPEISHPLYGQNFYIDFKIKDGGVLTVKKKNICNGDIIKGENILPKISIKDFLISLCKYHNLDIRFKNGKININKKLYTDKNTQLKIANINGINPKLFEFNKLNITYKLPESELLNEYKELYKESYGQKNINLNYTIKKDTKTIEYNVGVPIYMKDYSKLGYDFFTEYYNAGYSRYNYGVTTGFKDTIVFCFLNKINDTLYLTNDTIYEIGIKVAGTAYEPEEYKLIKCNLNISQANGKFYFNNRNTNNQSFKLNEYYTVSPYVFNPDNTIKKSLEINKPKYIYSNISDLSYSDSVTHYDKYFKKTVSDRYNVNNHIIDCDILFDNPVDIYEIYHYHNVDYVINEIPEYDPTNNYIKGIKLLKVNDKDNYLYPYGLEEGNITVQSFTNISKNSIVVNNRINYTGGDRIVTGGILYGTSTNNLNQSITINNPNTLFSITLSGLIKNTNYYVRPYMVSATGIYTYGTIYEQRTSDDYSVPSLKIDNYYDIKYTQFNVLGTINSQGGYPITEYGFVYSTSSLPTINNGKKIVGNNNAFGSYSTIISNLNSNTNYYVRAYAINQNGVGYSNNQLLVKTLQITVPTLTTVTPYSVQQNDGYSGGINLVENGSPISQKGIVIQVAGEGTPSVTNNIFKSEIGLGKSNFSSYFDGLITNEAFFVRAYATNSAGVGYGQEVGFNTLPLQTAEVITDSLSYNITNESVTLRGQMEYNGGDLNDIEEFGVVISKTNTNPTDGGLYCASYYAVHPILENGDIFSVDINGLDSNQIYYYRAFVYNSTGIGYGETYSFVTDLDNAVIFNHSLTRSIDYWGNVNLNFNYTYSGQVLTYGVIYSAISNDLTFNDSYFYVERGDPSGTVGTTFYDSVFENGVIGSYYCRMFIETTEGYVYSNVIMDSQS